MKQGEGSVVAISISRKKGIAKTNVPNVVIREEWGIEGDIHAGKWHRQISLLAIESIAKMRAKGLKVRPGAFAENITTVGIDIANLLAGDRLCVGDTELEVTQIGKECHAKCAIFFRVGDCVMPREGIFVRVIRGGRIATGDSILVLDGRAQSHAHAMQ